jgi:hypothetical protein
MQPQGHIATGDGDFKGAPGGTIWTSALNIKALILLYIFDKSLNA